MLRWVHFGEGEYQGTEAVIREELAGAGDLPEPLSPLRPTDAPGRARRRAERGGVPRRIAVGAVGRGRRRAAPASVEYSAGEAWATVDGRGSLGVSLDGADEVAIEVTAPGAYRLAAHPHHESHRLSLRASSGLSVYSVGFAAGLPS